jgi:hypothetical protein
LAGKKTYISAGAIILVALFGLWSGQLGEGGVLVLLGMAGGMLGIRDHNERKAKAVLDAVLEVKSVVADLKAGKKVDVLREAAKAEQIAEPFVAGDAAR